MFAKTLGAGINGLNGILVTVEVDLSNGLPGMDIVGLPDTAVRESKERVRAALRNAGFEFPNRKITVNLAPADLRKDGSGLDLPIAVGILAASGQLTECDLAGTVMVGELSLDAQLRGVNGILPMVVMCREIGLEKIILPEANEAEAKIVENLQICAVNDLLTAVQVLRGAWKRTDCHELQQPISLTPVFPEDFRDVQGQTAAKRAIEVAAAGGHNLMMTGPPGAGKTMLARRIPSILPPMSNEEALEVSKIYSVAGLLNARNGLLNQRPFRAPHHTISAVAMAGGGRIPRPGEVTLAHHGVLFLDELPEFSRSVLEVLRQPIEDGQVTVSRVNASHSYPSRFMLVVSRNPCPCGYLGDSLQECRCSEMEINRYLRKISGPLLDRIDMQVTVSRLKYAEMSAATSGESSAAIAARVAAARVRQCERLMGTGIFCNAQMSHRQIKEFCKLQREAQMLLQQSFDRMKLNARSYDRIIKVARTIADLACAETIGALHMAEALQMRMPAGDSS